MRMGMTTMAMGSGGGVGASYINPDIPAVGNIVRAWSLRRNVPEYLLGNSIRADRPSAPVGSPGLLGSFNTAGVIDFPAGADANAYELLDQKGNANSKLINANLANSPAVYVSGAMLDGLSFDGTDALAMATDDLTAYMDSISNPVSIVVWAKIPLDGAGHRATDQRIIFHRGGAGAFGFSFQKDTGKPMLWRANFGIKAADTAYDDNAWHMYVITRVADTTKALNSLYIDGGNLSVYASEAPSIGSIPLCIGGTTNMYTYGRINDILIYNIALSTSQMDSIYAAQKGYYGL